MHLPCTRPAARTRLAAAALATVLAAGLLGAAGCRAGAGGGRAQAAPSAGASAGVDLLAEARSHVDALYRGTFRAPDPASRPAAKGKKIVIISAGQSSPTSAGPVNAAAEAARVLGWDAQVYDAQFNPAANGAKLVRDAIAAGADGIVANFDCAAAPGAFAEARAKGVMVVPLYGFDCGTGDKALFSGYVNNGVSGPRTAEELTAAAGAVIADVMIAATDGHAQVIVFNDPAFTILRYLNAGFLARIRQCAGCQVLAAVDFLTTDLGPAFQQKVASTLLKFPRANAIKSPYTAATLAGIAPAVVRSGRQDQIFVLGGEGLPQDLDLIRTDKGLNACLLTDAAWNGWAVVDTLNSLFLGQKPRASGLGTLLIDRDHNLPPSGPITHAIDFRAAYKHAWGVS
jgi:ribose transport system substrate-binding protein